MELLDILMETRALIVTFTKEDREQASVNARRVRVFCENPGGLHRDLLGYSTDLLAYVNSAKQKDAIDQVDEMIRLIGQQPKRSGKVHEV